MKNEIKRTSESNIANYVRFVQDIDSNMKPIYYMFLNIIGGHYQLISYDHKCLFQPQEIPYSLAYLLRQRMLIDDKHLDPFIMTRNFIKLEQTIVNLD